MKKILSFILIFCVASLTFASKKNVFAGAKGEVKTRIETCDKLIEQKQYLSAFNALGDDNSDYIIAKKVNVVIKYFAQSIMHQVFALKDLSAGEDLLQIRKNGAEHLDAILFEPEKAIEDYAKNNSMTEILNLALSSYYADCFLRYGNNWLKTPQELYELSTSNFDKAYKKGIYDFDSTELVAEVGFMSRHFDQAAKYYEIAVKLNNKNGSTWYNLAVCYMYLSQYDKAIKTIKNSIKYPEENEKNFMDAYLLLADAYRLNGKNRDAQKTLLDAKKKFPKFYEPSLKLANLYFENKKISDGAAELNNTFAENTTDVLFDEIITTFLKAELYEEAIAFTQKNLLLVQNSNYMSFLLNYYLVQLYASHDENSLALEKVDVAMSFLEKAKIHEDTAKEYKRQLVKYKEYLGKNVSNNNSRDQKNNILKPIVM